MLIVVPFVLILDVSTSGRKIVVLPAQWDYLGKAET